jgi:hypothetical protein
MGSEMVYKIGSEYYIHEKADDHNPAMTERMMARLCSDKHDQAGKDIRGGSRVTLLKPTSWDKVRLVSSAANLRNCLAEIFKRQAGREPVEWPDQLCGKQFRPCWAAA